MGCSTHGILNKSVKIGDIVKVIKENIDNNVKSFFKEDCYYGKEYKQGFMEFNYNGENRRLFYCVTMDEEENTIYDKQLHGNLTLGYWGNSEVILQIILSYFGGYIDVNDCDGIGYYRVEKTKSLDNINIDTPIEYLLKALNEVKDASLQNIIRQVIFSNSIDEEKLKEIIELNRPEMIGKLI